MPSSYVRFVEFDWLFRRRVLIGLAGSRVRFKCFLTFVRKKSDRFEVSQFGAFFFGRYICEQW